MLGQHRFVLRLGRRIHADIFTFDIDNDDRPAAGRCFLDQHLGRVRLPRTDGAENADVARQDILALALQTHGNAIPTGERTKAHIAGTAKQFAHFGRAENADDRSGGRAIRSVRRSPSVEFSFNFNADKDIALGSIRKERPGDHPAQKSSFPKQIFDADVPASHGMGPMGVRHADDHLFVDRRRPVRLNGAENGAISVELQNLLHVKINDGIIGIGLGDILGVNGHQEVLVQRIGNAWVHLKSRMKRMRSWTDWWRMPRKPDRSVIKSEARKQSSSCQCR